MIATLIAWAKSLMPKPVPMQPSRLSNNDMLRIWVEVHMPELYEELASLPRSKLRVRLNEITGCNVPIEGRVEDGCAVFLAALKKMKGSAPMPRPTDPSDIARWVAQNMPGNQKNEEKS